MRELRRAAREGPREVLVAVADLPHRHPFAIGGALVGLVVAYLFAAQISTQNQVDVLRPQVTEIVRAASACSGDTLNDRRASNACSARLRVALLNCRQHPSCRAAFLANLRPPTKGTPQIRRSGLQEGAAPAGDDTAPVEGPAGTGPQGGAGGGQDGSHAPPHHGQQHTPPKSPPGHGQEPQAPPPIEAGRAEPGAPEGGAEAEAPGASGDTPGAGKALEAEACVLGICAKAGAGQGSGLQVGVGRDETPPE